jgi:hypothetical protein
LSPQLLKTVIRKLRERNAASAGNCIAPIR